MAESRHRHVARAPRRLRAAGWALPVAGLVAVAAAGTAVIAYEDAPRVSAEPARTAEPRIGVFAAAAAEGAPTVSRGGDRAPLPNEAEAADKVEGRRYARADLDIHADAAKASPVLAEVAFGDTVKITGVVQGDWAQIMHNGAPRWVLAKQISAQQPLGTAPCPYGSEGGLRPDTVKVLRAVCARFPSVTRYGGTAGRGEHATGRALDIMVSSDLGNQIAAFLQQHRAELGVEYLIWRQRIWRPATSPNWRGMASRGGATANHMDHVHVTTYGNAATR